jgi:hypothetical protein
MPRREVSLTEPEWLACDDPEAMDPGSFGR